ncbi:DNA-3-methyladenine glycosylase family protein [Zavarzinia sp. CC-PAN008]|uniref:DNA-3-methyladenine glycosylase family protein n=1 Tax=Zavarzinia sp. CC-PAN008 TaxID=3243332 RepID=UPI003F74A7D4
MVDDTETDARLCIHAAALRALRSADPDIARALDQAGIPELRIRAPGFGTLLRIIVDQQVSTASGAAIWRRLEALVDPADPAAILAAGAEALVTAGFSRPKQRYALGLAQAIVEGRFDPAAVAALPDAQAIAALVALPGLGRWSAEVYLMFAHGRPDLWPAHDVALQEAARRLKGLEQRPDVRGMDRLAEAWRPHRSTAALVLWRYYAWSLGRTVAPAG